MLEEDMFDIASHCRTREEQLQAAGIHIADILLKAGVDRSSWTGWKCRDISPRLSTLKKVEEEIEKALAEKERAA